MPDDLVKIAFNIDPEDWHLTSSEAVWAKVLKELGGFRVMNTPYFIRGISFMDVVLAKPIGPEGFLEFTGIVCERSGHSTYRLLVPPFDNTFHRMWKGLEEIGCTYECLRGIQTSLGEKDLFAVDVPPRAYIYKAYEVFASGEREKIWLFEEGHVGHSLRDS
jgi:hypothetical protein